jgi:hypothetical protein
MKNMTYPLHTSYLEYIIRCTGRMQVITEYERHGIQKCEKDMRPLDPFRHGLTTPDLNAASMPSVSRLLGTYENIDELLAHLSSMQECTMVWKWPLHHHTRDVEHAYELLKSCNRMYTLLQAAFP